MLFILSLVLAFAFAFLCAKPLKKQPYVFYALAVIITVIVSCFNFRGLSPAVNTYILGLFTRGAFATGLWCVVMWTGAFPNGSKPMKALMPVRGELSIFAALLTLGHNIGFGKTYFIRLFTDAGRMSSTQITASVLTLVMLAIMIPLTVLSFPKVRRKFKASVWKKIQRTAYIFYALIYIHVLTLFAPMAKMNRDGYFLSIIVYSAVFIGYAVCRVRKAYLLSCKKQQKQVNRKVINAFCEAAFLLVMVFPCLYARPVSENNTVPVQQTQGNITEAALKTAVTDQQDSAVTGTSVSTSAPVTSVSVSVSDTDVTAVTEVSGEQTTAAAEETKPEENEQNQNQDQNQNHPAEEEHHEEEQTPVQEENPEPEIQYIYNNGSYTASAYGYDGDVTVTVTIENDVITSITGSTGEIDSSYFEAAKDYVFSQILSSGSTNVSAYAGSTYSSNAIMSAVAQALNSARR